MVPAIIGLVLLIILIIVAVRMISIKHLPEDIIQESVREPAIHASGIYSIIRRSPRDDLLRIRPPEAEIRKYLASRNVDINKRPLTESDRQKLADTYRKAMEENISVIERGDAENIEFYYFDSECNWKCPVCTPYMNHGQFVSRQEIFKHPSVIPPFHLGCTTRIMPYRGKENLRETARVGMAPFFTGDVPPPLPQWKDTVSLP